MKNMILILILSATILGCEAYNAGSEITNSKASPYDFGDAPDIYSTLLVSDGARHLIDQSLYLGSSVDGEEDGTSSTAADGDNDDGAAFSGSIIKGNNATLIVTVESSVSSAFLNIWIDFNADFDWADPGEQALTNQSVVAGTQSLGISIPASSAVGATYMRIRLSTIDVSSTGLGGIGEVEDYRIQIE